MNDQLYAHLKNVPAEGLTPAERDRMRTAILEYARMRPLSRDPGTSASRSIGRWLFSPRPVAAALVVAVFISTAGITYAAEGALPGDLLYPIKTNIDEPVQGALALSSKAKAAWASAVAGTRIREAATLAAQGRLSSPVEATLRQSFEAHAAIANAAIEGVASTSPDAGAEAALSFEAQLAEYGDVLAQIGSAMHANVNALSASIAAERAVAAEVGARALQGSGGALAAARVRDAAQNSLASSLKLADDASGALSSSSQAMVSAQLANASSTIAAGEDLAARDSVAGAIGAFGNALTAAEKLRVYLETSAAIHSRTGLIVGEPAAREHASAMQPAAAPAAAPSTSAAATAPGGEIERTMRPVRAAVRADAQATATTTPPQEATSTPSQRSADDAQDNEHEGHGRQLLPLPISVPVQPDL